MEKSGPRMGLSTFVFLYAIVSGLLNACLPIIDALSQKTIQSMERGKVEHEFFLEVFHVLQYGVAVLCILALTALICHAQRTCCVCSTCCCPDPGPDEDRAAVEGGEELRIAPLATPESGRVKVRRPTPNCDASVTVTPREKGVNLYLRLGALGFGFGVMIYDGFKISDKVHTVLHNCGYSQLWIPKYSLHFIYIFLQTFFVVKHYNFRFLRLTHLVQFCMAHLVVTNFGQWFKIVIYEVMDGVMQKESRAASRNSSRAARANASGQADPCVGLSDRMAPFLFPCVIEYSLIAGAICFRLLQMSIGPGRRSAMGSVPVKRASLISVQAINKRYADCHKAHKGLFIGLFLLMGTLVSMAIFFLFSEELHSISTLRVYQMTESALLGVTLILSVWALICVRSLHRYNSRVWTMEIALLCIGFSGIFFHDLLLLIPAVPEALKGDLEAILFIVNSGVEMLQAVVQMQLLLEGQRRCASSVDEVRRKPGRAVLTCLLLSNLALWLVNTFEVKYVVEQSFQADYYNATAWGILARILLPLIIFFRFHSSVCLSAIWSNVYKLRA